MRTLQDIVLDLEMSETEDWLALFDEETSEFKEYTDNAQELH